MSRILLELTIEASATVTPAAANPSPESGTNEGEGK